MNRSIKIANRQISPNDPPFIIAEMSGNHNQSLEKALKIVEAAAKAGAHAIKLQTYTADTMTIDADSASFFINDLNSLWNGQSLYNLYQKAYTPWEWHKQIFEYCSKLGLIGFSTPFDETAVDFLESLNVPAYKIASFENNHLPLIKKVATTGKPLIISIGMATVAELDEMVKTAREAGCNEIILLKCTNAYPAAPEDINLLTIPHLRKLFDTEVGLSDHTPGVGVSVAGVALGAMVIEKHFTLSRGDGGVDSEFSMEPNEMKLLVDETLTAWKALGEVKYGLADKEKATSQFRRSIYVVEDVKEGDALASQNIRIIRPGGGLDPKYYEMLLGRKVCRSIKRGTPMGWEFLV
ncbi:MAG: pseudaminic acid synthase [Candidatus Scalindua rubra]|uniref:N-acetyl neuramic acid synthetase NeuB n=1 Tax=Candidatus Scalindua brodae TaxID=237368 RepID=A0A0B0EBE8_9BACT|nr:MAG: N-acetyl neuramic acid synthetase NeuB [Candidatus Scalindua brodae]MBZ0109643.1 pseudaminic acid synthase [Candidatus Scalindua rubra]TWU33102.1 Pseudaminic acid synthase [Candidatus Brocadiaceae bacterium S225]